MQQRGAGGGAEGSEPALEADADRAAVDAVGERGRVPGLAAKPGLTTPLRLQRCRMEQAPPSLQSASSADRAAWIRAAMARNDVGAREEVLRVLRM